MTTPLRYGNAKWEDIPETIKKAFETITPGNRKGLYIHGAVGTGKTHICWALKKHYDKPEANKFLKIINVVDLMHEIRSDFDRPIGDKALPEYDLTNPEKRQILILDDIGAERATEFVAETLYRIINFRYNEMLPTIFTSNYTMQELADRIGERSASRIVEMTQIIELTGDDRRIQK